MRPAEDIPSCTPLSMSLEVRAQDELHQVRAELNRAAIRYAEKYGGSIVGQYEIMLGHMLQRTFYWMPPR